MLCSLVLYLLVGGCSLIWPFLLCLIVILGPPRLLSLFVVLLSGLLLGFLLLIKVGALSLLRSLGQRPLSVLPVAYRIWASARMKQLEDWLQSWVPSCVCSAGNGRSSVEAWYTTAFDIEEVLAGAVDTHVHIFVADVVKSFDTVDRSILNEF